MKIKPLIKMGTIATVCATAIGVGSLFVSNNETYADATQLAEEVTQNIENSKYETVKMVKPNGEYTIWWRDKVNARECREEYDSAGNLLTKMLIVDGGKRIISMKNVDGKMEALSWELAKSAADENEKILKKSILADIKNDSESKNWKMNAAEKASNQIEAETSNSKIILYLDENKKLPVKRETYPKENGQLLKNDKGKIVEEYKIQSSIPDEVFNINDIQTKDVGTQEDANLGIG